jgi:hypothetical protein
VTSLYSQSRRSCIILNSCVKSPSPTPSVTKPVLLRPHSSQSAQIRPSRLYCHSANHKSMHTKLKAVPIPLSPNCDINQNRDKYQYSDTSYHLQTQQCSPSFHCSFQCPIFETPSIRFYPPHHPPVPPMPSNRSLQTHSNLACLMFPTRPKFQICDKSSKIRSMKKNTTKDRCSLLACY